MSTVTTRRRIFMMLVMLILLLTSLLPPARPVHAGVPEEDASIHSQWPIFRCPTRSKGYGRR